MLVLDPSCVCVRVYVSHASLLPTCERHNDIHDMQAARHRTIVRHWAILSIVCSMIITYFFAFFLSCCCLLLVSFLSFDCHRWARSTIFLYLFFVYRYYLQSIRDVFFTGALVHHSIEWTRPENMATLEFSFSRRCAHTHTHSEREIIMGSRHTVNGNTSNVIVIIIIIITLASAWQHVDSIPENILEKSTNGRNMQSIYSRVSCISIFSLPFVECVALSLSLCGSLFQFPALNYICTDCRIENKNSSTEHDIDDDEQRKRRAERQKHAEERMGPL